MKIAIIVQWLAVLACPVMMLWCMWSMFGGRKRRATCGDEHVGGSGNVRELGDQIRGLKARVEELEAERKVVAKPVADIAGGDGTSRTAAFHR